MRDLHLALTSLQTLFRTNGLQWLAVEVNPRAISRPEQATVKLRSVKMLLSLRPPPRFIEGRIADGIKRVETAVSSIG